MNDILHSFNTNKRNEKQMKTDQITWNVWNIIPTQNKNVSEKHLRRENIKEICNILQIEVILKQIKTMKKKKPQTNFNFVSIFGINNKKGRYFFLVS